MLLSAIPTSSGRSPFRRQAPLTERGVAAAGVVALGGLAVLVVLAACGSDKKTPTQPQIRAECVVPTTTSFVDSAQGRVVVGNFSYAPAEVHIRHGQSVKWVHCGPEVDTHTVTADSGAFDSGFIKKDSSFTQSFPTAGRFPYHCVPHPDMQAVIVVEP